LGELGNSQASDFKGSQAARSGRARKGGEADQKSGMLTDLIDGRGRRATQSEGGLKGGEVGGSKDTQHVLL